MPKIEVTKAEVRILIEHYEKLFHEVADLGFETKAKISKKHFHNAAVIEERIFDLMEFIGESPFKPIKSRRNKPPTSH